MNIQNNQLTYSEKYNINVETVVSYSEQWLEPRWSTTIRIRTVQPTSIEHRYSIPLLSDNKGNEDIMPQLQNSQRNSHIF